MLYEELIQSYRARISNYNCVEDHDVLNYINDKPDEALTIAKKGLNALIHVNNLLIGDDQSVPKFIIGSSESIIDNVLDSFHKRGFRDFKKEGNGKLEIEDLKNMVVFYNEKFGFLPLRDISYIDRMKNAYENKPRSFDDDQETWLNYRNAYFRPNQKNELCMDYDEKNIKSIKDIEE